MAKRGRSVLLGAIATLLLVTTLDLAGLSELPFYSHGEPREAVVVQEMWRGNGLLLPLINGDIIPWKPPLFHWLGLLVANIRGAVDELSARLPSVGLGILGTLAVFLFGASVGRVRSGWLAALILATNFEWLRASRTARVDMTLAFFLAGSLLCFAFLQHRERTTGSPFGVARWVFWALLVAGTLTKGPVGFILPLLVIGAWALTARKETLPTGVSPRTGRFENLRATARAIGTARGLAFALPVIAAWYLAGWWIGGTDFLVRHALMENIFRVLDAERLGSGHVHGPLYMVVHLFLGFLPWSLLAPPVTYWLWKTPRLDETTRFLVIWVLVIFVVFLVPDSKRGVYLLPAYPAMALLCGLTLGPGPEGHLPRRFVSWTFSGIALFAAATSLVATLPFLLPLPDLLAPFLKPHDLDGAAAALAALNNGGLFTVLIMVSICVGAGLVVWQARGAHWFRASLPMAAVLVLLIVGIILPAERGIAESRTLRAFAQRASKIAATDSIGIVSSSFEWGTLFYVDRHLPTYEHGGPEPDFLIFRNTEENEVPGNYETALASEGTGPRGRHRFFLAKRRTDP